MMVTTHAFLGLAVASLTVFVAPEYSLAAGVGAISGGVFPDFDVLFKHRKTLHFPAYYTFLTAFVAPLVVFFTSPGTVFVFFFVASAALHSVSDIIGGGIELKPWEAKSDKAVYLHYKKYWVKPRRWIRYDGSPEDFVVGFGLAVPSILLYDGVIRKIGILGVAVSLIYTVLRKKVVEYAPDALK